MIARVLMALVSLAACAPEFGDGDEHFYITHKGASMPVWVTGNWRSNRIIVHVHGGPGTTNGIYYQKRSFQRLAEDHGIVFYEQRGSGSAHGLHREHLTVEQFVEDLDNVFTVLEARYPDAEFVLMGHSWGGHLGFAYLLDPARQARVKGWIEQDGAHDSSCKTWQVGVDWVLAHAAEVLAGSPGRKTRRFWEGARAFYRDTFVCDLETNENNMNAPHEGSTVHLGHSLYVRAAGGYDVDPERVLNTEETLELLFKSQFDLVAVTRHGPLPVEGYYGVDLTPRLAAITLPTLILWGRHDWITPVTAAQPAFDALGTPAERKRLVIFEDSGHNPWAEEQDKFYDEVSDFLALVWP